MACRRCRRPQTHAEAFCPRNIWIPADVTQVAARLPGCGQSGREIGTGGSRMNKSMLMGVVAGIGVATAGGVLGYQFLGPQGAEVEGDEVIVEAEALTSADAGTRGADCGSPGRACRGGSRPHRRVLGRGSPGDGRPEGSSTGSRAPRSAPWSAARSARISATATSRRQPARLPALSSGARSREKSRRTAPISARRRPSSAAAARRAALLAKSPFAANSRAGPATVRPFFFSCGRIAGRPANANDLHQQRGFGRLTVPP